MPSLIPEYDVISFSEFMTATVAPEDKLSWKKELQAILDTYSCPRNPDVEAFLKNRAIEQYVRRAGMSYLVFAADTGDLVGYFTLALRPFAIPLSIVSNSQRKRLRCCGLQEISHTAAVNNASQGEDTVREDSFYEASAFLIGQLGKNYAEDITSTIRGTELLDLAFEPIYDIQDLAGGRLAIVEAEDRESLIRFYENYGFRRFGERIASSTQPDSGRRLIQMFQLIKGRKSTPAEKSDHGS